MASKEQRLISAAEHSTVELGGASRHVEPTEIKLSWKDYKALVTERDEARAWFETARKAQVWRICDECGFYRSDGQQMRKERDEARAAQAEALERYREDVRDLHARIGNLTVDLEDAKSERDEARSLCREVLLRLIRHAHAYGERTGNVIKQWSKRYPWIAPQEPAE